MRRNKPWIVLVLAVVMGLALMGQAWAGIGPPLFGNGNFETGDLSDWFGAGDVGVADFNVINGSYSAYLTTAGWDDGGSPLSESPAVNEMCSFLWSGVLIPTYFPEAVVVNFKVRYKTDEGIGPYVIEDPFTAELVTGWGTVDLVTIKADGLTPGPGTTVTNLATGLKLPPPPTVPPNAGSGMYFAETPTLAVRSQVPYGSCDPVFVKFMICDFLYPDVDSAAFIDDVSITTLSGGGGGGGPGGGAPALCPPIDDKPVPAWSRKR